MEEILRIIIRTGIFFLLFVVGCLFLDITTASLIVAIIATISAVSGSRITSYAGIALGILLSIFVTGIERDSVVGAITCVIGITLVVLASGVVPKDEEFLWKKDVPMGALSLFFIFTLIHTVRVWNFF